MKLIMSTDSKKNPESANVMLITSLTSSCMFLHLSPETAAGVPGKYQKLVCSLLCLEGSVQN